MRLFARKVLCRSSRRSQDERVCFRDDRDVPVREAGIGSTLPGEILTRRCLTLSFCVGRNSSPDTMPYVGINHARAIWGWWFVLFRCQNETRLGIASLFVGEFKLTMWPACCCCFRGEVMRLNKNTPWGAHCRAYAAHGGCCWRRVCRYCTA